MTTLLCTLFMRKPLAQNQYQRPVPPPGVSEAAVPPPTVMLSFVTRAKQSIDARRVY
jgi:hypothetical protein